MLSVDNTTFDTIDREHCDKKSQGVRINIEFIIWRIKWAATARPYPPIRSQLVYGKNITTFWAYNKVQVTSSCFCKFFICINDSSIIELCALSVNYLPGFLTHPGNINSRGAPLMKCSVSNRWAVFQFQFFLCFLFFCWVLQKQASAPNVQLATATPRAAPIGTLAACEEEASSESAAPTCVFPWRDSM